MLSLIEKVPGGAHVLIVDVAEGYADRLGSESVNRLGDRLRDVSNLHQIEELYVVSRTYEGGGDAAESERNRAHVNIRSIGGDEKNSYCALRLARLCWQVRVRELILVAQ